MWPLCKFYQVGLKDLNKTKTFCVHVYLRVGKYMADEKNLADEKKVSILLYRTEYFLIGERLTTAIMQRDIDAIGPVTESQCANAASNQECISHVGLFMRGFEYRRFLAISFCLLFADLSSSYRNKYVS